MKKIVLTGSTGFLGSALTSRLNAEGFQTVGLIYGDSGKGVRETYATEDLYFNHVTDLDSLIDWATVDAVMHLATNYGRDGSAALEMCNVELPKKLLALSQQFGVPNFINADSFFSDVSIFYPYLQEYRESKLRFREFARASAGSYDTKVINLRIFHMYGPNDNKGKFVHEMLELIRSNAVEIDLTNGAQLRDFVYIDDVVDAFYCIVRNASSLSRGFTSFDICTNQSVSIKCFLTAIKDKWCSDTRLNFGAIPTREGEFHLENMVADNSGLIDLGWIVKSNYVDGIANIFDCVEENK